jgi:5-oxopent-3-ene-1,2,5-tricarboxylate decarboxylase/2-hydroxyhepta-2,4-diene-1,7-dioate isomerase
MVGTDCLADGTRPRAKAGDRVEISTPGFASVVTNVKGQP